MSTWSACTWAFIHICFFVRHDRSPRSQPVFGCVRAAWNSIDIVRTVGPFARKRTSFSLYCYVIGLFNRPRPNHRHNGKECCSVVSSRFFGGNVAWHPKKRLRRRLCKHQCNRICTDPCKQAVQEQSFVLAKICPDPCKRSLREFIREQIDLIVDFP